MIKYFIFLPSFTRIPDAVVLQSNFSISLFTVHTSLQINDYIVLDTNEEQSSAAVIGSYRKLV
jgi:hypothetical protein